MNIWVFIALMSSCGAGLSLGFLIGAIIGNVALRFTLRKEGYKIIIDTDQKLGNRRYTVWYDSHHSSKPMFTEEEPDDQL